MVILRNNRSCIRYVIAVMLSLVVILLIYVIYSVFPLNSYLFDDGECWQSGDGKFTYKGYKGTFISGETSQSFEIYTLYDGKTVHFCKEIHNETITESDVIVELEIIFGINSCYVARINETNLDEYQEGDIIFFRKTT